MNTLAHPIPSGRRLMLTLLAGVVLGCALLPMDDALARALSPHHGGLGSMLGGDLRRELEFVQQFGAVTSVIIAGCVVLLTRPTARAMVVRMALACAANGLALNVLKMLLGRPRPRVVYHPQVSPEMASPLSFVFFWKDATLPREDGALVAKSWQISRGISSDLWSMPSSHTAAAFCLAACLIVIEPRVRWLVLALAGVVGVARVVTGAHFVSDVVVGGSVGWCVGMLVMGVGTRSRRPLEV